MLKMKLKYSGIQQTLINFAGADDFFKNNFLNKLGEAAQILYDTVKSPGYTPVDTGTLRDSIAITFNPNIPEARVGPDMRQAPYAEWVEFGHFQRDGKWLPGQHYLDRAYRDSKDKMIGVIQAGLANALSNYGRNVNAGRVTHKTTGQFVGRFW